MEFYQKCMEKIGNGLNRNINDIDFQYNYQKIAKKEVYLLML